MKTKNEPTNEEIRKRMSMLGQKPLEIKGTIWIKEHVWQTAIAAVTILVILAQIKYNDLLFSLALLIFFIFGFGAGIDYKDSKNNQLHGS